MSVGSIASVSRTEQREIPAAPSAGLALSERDLKALATTRLRAETLLDDGYSVHPDHDRPGIYVVETPTKFLPRTREPYTDQYTVDVTAGTCDCPAFMRLGTCKHSIAILRAVAEALRLVGPMIPVSRALATTVRASNTSLGYWYVQLAGESVEAEITRIPDGRAAAHLQVTCSVCNGYYRTVEGDLCCHAEAVEQHIEATVRAEVEAAAARYNRPARISQAQMERDFA